MSTVEQQIVMKIPEEIVRAQVQAAVVAALGKDPEKLVEAMVKASLATKADNYGRETLFEKMMRDLVHQTAIEAFKEWLEGMRPAIRKQIVAVLDTRKKEQIAKMADLLLTSLEGADFHVSIRNPGD